MKRALFAYLLMLSVSLMQAQEDDILARGEQGDANAQNEIGVMYANGDGVIKDAAEAVKWYRKAAEQGLAGAQLILGWMYVHGDGVIKDLVEAHAWFNVAGANGLEFAKDYLKIIEKEMTREQIAGATKLAKERFERINASNAKR